MSVIPGVPSVARIRRLRGLLTLLLLLPVAARAEGQAPGQAAAALRIVVIAGEDAVNVIQQKTAVAPIVEVRDRNDLPVSGATVTFVIGGNNGTFAGGLQTLTVTTNAAGRAAASALNPIGTGTVQINVQAAFQGQTAVASIAQTNVLTVAEAGAATGGGGTGGAGAAPAVGGGWMSATTLGVIGAAAVGGVMATRRVVGNDSTSRYSAQFSGTLPMTFAFCTRNEAHTGTLEIELIENDGTVSGTASVRANVTVTPGSCDPAQPPNNGTDTFGLQSGSVSGTPASLSFTGSASNTFPAGPGTGSGVNAYFFSFTGALGSGEIVGTLSIRREISPPAPSPPTGIGSIVHNVSLRP